mmetsp:Transcript_138760/g.386963  ORF Transcript_138760/g.386963 Transcript_138760/m.386963 type:complete len:217 (+) Transcript_138760:584-1234(+)
MAEGLKVAHAPLRAGAASGRAVALLPVPPLAIDRVAYPRALPSLLGGFEPARGTSVLGHLENEPETLALASALVAGAPVVPSTPYARLRRNRTHVARLKMALVLLGERPDTGPPAKFCLRCDAPTARSLAVAAGDAALAPIHPIAELAVHLRILPETTRGGCDLVAGRNLLRGTAASLAIALSIRRNPARAVLDAIAGARTVAPLVPLAEQARDVS